MSAFLARVFSDRYANHGTIGHNLLLLAMYRFAYPFARALNALGLTPNQLTALSCVAAVAAAAALALHPGAWVFVVFWGASLMLDFCDGTVARMSGRVSRNAFRFDHMSDLVKVSIVIVAAAWRQQDELVWVLASAALFAFLYYAVISQELKTVRLQLPAHTDEPAATSGGFQSRLPPPLRVTYAALATVNGHTLLIFFALPFGFAGAAFTLCYLTAITIFGVLIRVRILLSLPKPRKI
ncbi:MAG: CDP-alcohol phosphatidyltransferase family protein [Betaproteobacteria bacterium]|nr:CDP-alcohol phosphatidyltransferase family protein [Betaproteobacteria bacterium]